MATPTTGTIPALPQYGTGALVIATTVSIEIVDTSNATAAVSYRMLQTDFVGKAPGAMTPANPKASDVITFLQAATNLPFVTTIGNLSIPSGNLPTGGGTGTLLNKTSATNYDAGWSGISSFLSASTSITLSGSTTVAVSVTAQGISSTQIANNAVGNAQIRQGPAVSVIGVAGNATSNVADIVSGSGTTVLLSSAANDAVSFGHLTTAYMPIQLQLVNVTANGVMYGNGVSSPLAATNFGTTGMFLMGNGSNSAPGFALVNLGNSTSVTGTTAIANGGTGTNVLTPWGVVVGGTTTLQIAVSGATSLPLVSNGTNALPSFQALGFAGGGTGTTTLATPWGVVIGGTTTLQITAAGGTGTLLAGVSATAAPTFISVSAALNTVNTTQGTLLYRDSAAWLGLAGSTAGYLLQTLGTAANPSWVGSGGTLLNTIAASQLGSAVDTTSFTSRYSKYRIAFENICPVATAQVTASLNLVVATTGVSWIVAGYISSVQAQVNATAAFASSTSVILLSGNAATTTIGTSTVYGANGFIEINNPANAVFRKGISGELSYMATGAAGTATMGIAFPTALWDGGSNAITGIAIAFQTGNIATGTIRIYGIS